MGPETGIETIMELEGGTAEESTGDGRSPRTHTDWWGGGGLESSDRSRGWIRRGVVQYDRGAELVKGPQ